MHKFIKKIFKRDAKTGQFTAPRVQDVLPRVDTQIGRAVTRLSDR